MKRDLSSAQRSAAERSEADQDGVEHIVKRSGYQKGVGGRNEGGRVGKSGIVGETGEGARNLRGT